MGEHLTQYWKDSGLGGKSLTALFLCRFSPHTATGGAIYKKGFFPQIIVRSLVWFYKNECKALDPNFMSMQDNIFFISTLENSVDNFWDQFGYISNDVEEEPSDEPKYLRKRAMQLPCTVQCGKLQAPL